MWIDYGMWYNVVGSGKVEGSVIAPPPVTALY